MSERKASLDGDALEQESKSLKSKTMFPLLTVCSKRGVEASRHQDNCNSGLVCLLGGPADQGSLRIWRGVPGAAAVGI